MKKIFLVILLSLAGACLVHASQLPQEAWAPYGALINNTPGNSSQQKPQIAPDGLGGYIIVFEDSRSGNFNIYAQRIDNQGRLLWNKNAIPISEADGNQTAPQIIADQNNGAIIVWQDYRSDKADIYAQRIDSSGEISWQKDGLKICDADANQLSPVIASDQSGGAIIAWHDYRSAKGEDVYAQRVSSQGKILWQENGVVVVDEEGTQWFPKIASDGDNGAIIAWADGRRSSSNYDIYVQRLSGEGKPLWQKNGLAVCFAINNQETPQIVNDGQPIIVWSDSRAGNLDVYAQKISLEGSILWQKDGVPVCINRADQKDPSIASDGEGGTVISWTDERGDDDDIYAQRLSKDGEELWEADGRLVSKFKGNQQKSMVLKAKGQNWFIIWQDLRWGTRDLFCQKLSRQGFALWKVDGVALNAAPDSQEYQSAVVGQDDSLVVTWQDRRPGNFDIYAQKVLSSGELDWNPSGIIVNNSTGSVAHQNLELINDGQNGIILVFEDARSGYFNIYAQRVDSQGNLSWGKDGLAVCPTSAVQRNPKILSDNKGGAIIIWEDHRSDKHPKIYAQRLDPQGNALWDEDGLAVDLAKADQTDPRLVPADDGVIVAWVDLRDSLNLSDIYAQKLSFDGRRLWGEKGKPVAAFNGEQTSVALVSDTKGGMIAAWTDFRNGNRNPDIYAQRLNSLGNPAWPEDGVSVCTAPDYQRDPKIVSDGEGGAIIAWTDKGGGSYDIYAQRVSAGGKTLWTENGIPIVQVGRTQQNPIFGSSAVLIWEDYRYGDWDIFSQKFDLNGNVRWGEDGIPVVVATKTQYSPQALRLKDGSMIVVWEDYRSGNQYDIYLQHLDESGKKLWGSQGYLVKTKEGARSPKIVVNSLNDRFLIFWEDYRSGQRAICGQKFIID